MRIHSSWSTHHRGSAARTPWSIPAVLLAVSLAGCDGGDPIAPGDTGTDRSQAAVSPEDALRPGWLLGSNNFSPAAGVRSGFVFRIDLASGAGTQLGPPLPGGGVSLAFDEHNGRLYASLTPAVGPSQLARVDPLTGAATILGSIMLPDQGTRTARVAAMDFSGPYLHGFTTRGEGITIDPSTGEAKPAVSIGFIPAAYGSALGRDGIVYFLDVRALSTGGAAADLYKIFLPTGAPTPVLRYPLARSGSVGLSPGPGNALYAAIGSTLYKREPLGTTLVPIGDIGFPTVSGLTFVDEVAVHCPCGRSWASQAAYEGCVGDLATELLAAGRITPGQDAAIRATAAAKVCYRNGAA